MTVLTIPDPQLPLRLADLAQIQRLATTHLTFSLTLACPLRCEHCIVSSSPDLHHTTMPMPVAERYAAQMPALAERGITHISFTGGEPTIARRQLKVLSAAGRAAGMTCAVVTASPWARTEASARRTVQDLADVAVWDLSVDHFHEPFVSLDTVRRAHDTLVAAGRRVTIRFTYNDPDSDDTRRILDFVATLPDANVACQRVRPVGRGLEITVGRIRDYNPWVKPCVTQGLVIRYDGSVSPCCLNLVERRDHTFQYGDATQRDLADIHADFSTDTLLQLVRSLGFSEMIRLAEDEGLGHLVPRHLPSEACQMCELLMTDGELTRALRQRLDDPGTQLRLGVIAAKSLGEPHLLDAVLDRYAATADQLPGYDDAVAYRRTFHHPVRTRTNPEAAR